MGKPWWTRMLHQPEYRTLTWTPKTNMIGYIYTHTYIYIVLYSYTHTHRQKLTLKVTFLSIWVIFRVMLVFGENWICLDIFQVQYICLSSEVLQLHFFSHDQRVSYILSDAAVLFISRNERILWNLSSFLGGPVGRGCTCTPTYQTPLESARHVPALFATCGFASMSPSKKVICARSTPRKINILHQKMGGLEDDFPLFNWVNFRSHVHFQACSPPDYHNIPHLLTSLPSVSSPKPLAPALQQ